MSRSLIRWASLGLVALAAVGYFASRPAAAGSPGLQEPLPGDLLKSQLVKEEPADDELRRLLKARYNESLQELKCRHAAYALGRDRAESIVRAAGDVLETGCEVFVERNEKLRFIEMVLSHAKNLEAAEQQFEKEGRSTPADGHCARRARLDAEIRLVRSQRGK